MGLDMYLKKTKRIEKFKDDLAIYQHIEDSLEYLDWLEHWKENNEDIKSFKDYFKTEKELASNEDMMLLKKQHIKRYEYLTGPAAKSIWKPLHSWRKANQIHHWFIENVQDGFDDCDQYLVEKEQLEELLDLCQQISKHDFDQKIAKELLPTTGGFFFGSTAYDEDYRIDIEETIDILKKVLDTTDFEKEIVTYQSSW